MSRRKPLHIVFYLPSMSLGGVTRVVLNLASELGRRDHAVEIIVDSGEDAYKNVLPKNISITAIVPNKASYRKGLALLHHFRYSHKTLTEAMLRTTKPYFILQRLPLIADYLQHKKPDCLITTIGYTPFLAYWARELSGCQDIKIIATEHGALSRLFFEETIHWRRVLRLFQMKELIHDLYPRFDAVVSVSNGVLSDLSDVTRLDPSFIKTIYNPVVDESLVRKARKQPYHRWFVDGSVPVLLAVGRLTTQKNFQLLLNAFSKVRQFKECKLIIGGDGPLREQLKQQAASLGVGDSVDFPGWLENPYAFMSRASAFISSSDHEGFSIVIAEALACGCSIVATDCMSGPREILDNGQYGKLVPPRDVEALFRAIIETLDEKIDKNKLKQRAQVFSSQTSANAYETLIQSLLDGDEAAGKAIAL
jgi:glycosyltransferase involved in cell wall biosynthesis